MGIFLGASGLLRSEFDGPSRGVKGLASTHLYGMVPGDEISTLLSSNGRIW